MSQAIDDLRHEHDSILSALDILDRIEAEARQGTVATPIVRLFMTAPGAKWSRRFVPAPIVEG